MKEISIGRNGMLLLLVLVFLCILGVLVLTFNLSASHSQALSFRAEQEEISKKVLESALDEALFVFDSESRDSQSQFAQWLIDLNGVGANAPTLEFDSNKLVRTHEIVNSLNQTGVVPLTCPQVRISKRHLDWRNNRITGGTTVTYFGKEGHGTVVFQSTMKVSRGSRQFFQFNLEKHHDFKVICIVSGRGKPGREAAQNRNLDYSLYVREGLAEFNDSKGKMLNNSSLQLQIKPNSVGKIYFGGTDDSSKYVFLNISPDTSEFLLEQDNAVKGIDDNGSQKLADRILASDNAVQKGIEDARTYSEVGDYDTSDDSTFIKSVIKKENLSLKATNIPISSNPAGEKEKNAHDGLFDSIGTTGKPYDNTEPGIRILTQTDNPHQVIEGHVRQRYIYLVESTNMQSLFKKIKEVFSGFLAPDFFVAHSPEAFKKANQKGGGAIGGISYKIHLAIHQALDEILPPAPLKVQTTRVDDEVPYGLKKDEGSRGKQLNPYSIPLNYMPFSYANLRSYSALDGADLANLGFLAGNKLKVRGGIHVRAPFTLGDSGALEVDGQGVLSTNGDITIKAGITCPPNSVLILVSRGKVIIETSDRIDAGIVARSITVGSDKSFNLKGSLFVDRLGSENWPPGPHVLEYDSTNFGRENDVYSVTVSPRATFIRMSGNET